MSTVAIIPARGGSVGIPGKNVADVAGRPLLAWTLDAAHAAETVDRVVVTTDDDAIAQVATAGGADVIRRPAELATSEASSESALLHALEQLDAAGEQPDLTVFLQCTSPLTLPEDIDGTVRALQREQADCALAVTTFHGFLWQPDGAAVQPIGHELGHRPRRQDRPAQLLETGAVYVMRTAGFLAARHRFFGRVVGHEIPADRVLEVDEPPDLRRAEAALQARRAAVPTGLPATIGALVLDFDGVLTDGAVWLDVDGRESVRCDRRDGHGLSLVRDRDVPILILTREAGPIAPLRADKLRIDVRSGVKDKVAELSGWLDDRDIGWADVVYVGDDVTDVGCLTRAGCGVTVPDAHPTARAAADLVLDRPGGHGAVRELCDALVAHLDRPRTDPHPDHPHRRGPHA